MTQYLDSLKINDEIDITLPYGRFNYVKESQVAITTIE
jgi:NAD(P)H-flavin reductase